MIIDLNTITGFLGGSIVTLVIREIINQINRKVDFKRELKKITYQRKIEKAENAVAYFWTYLNKAIEVKKSFETILRAINEIEEVEKDFQLILDCLSQNSKTLTDLAGDKYYDINAIHLYFDLEDVNAWNEEDLGSLYDCMSELKYQDNEIKFWSSLHKSNLDTKNKKSADFCWQQMKNGLPKFVVSLQKFIDLIEKNRKATYSVIQKIKKQIL